MPFITQSIAAYLPSEFILSEGKLHDETKIQRVSVETAMNLAYRNGFDDGRFSPKARPYGAKDITAGSTWFVRVNGDQDVRRARVADIRNKVVKLEFWDLLGQQWWLIKDVEWIEEDTGSA